ncbi:alpha-amylase family glycosyl hydrolase [Cytophagaceae bacterium DM2B3-1]|uniref:1,4-alpha-glucan branching enzyme n=1 Tax=Xanthocytophaga flava TaxID=3048013 RepID=A0ABT7CN79_9BACT|nr:alpha-amylase family glycosyl hydrolase [Xanthocytophaga flavus]MDJ1495196.1 alpha-amylase family glycosyl hydrolase [Xanthocytophaga flavus]
MTKAKTSTHPSIQVAGMGSILHSKGTYFRVWAPHAEKVYVTGTFNKWAKTKNELQPEENGYWGCNVENAQAGHEYKYIIHTMDGRKLSRNDPYARVVTNSVGNSVIYDAHSFDWEDDAYQMPSWNELVIYELHIGTFNVTEEGKPGDFYSAIDRLPYLRALGINAVEIMPPFEFAGDYSWGYNPAHPFAIESAYGGPDAFKSFIKACHKNNIAVILDVVYNHFGPSDMDLWQFDGWSENNKGGIYFYNDWKSTTPWGDTRPDYGRGEVRQYIRDNALMWLEEYRCDGLRMDMIPYIRNVHANENPADNLHDGFSLLQWINREISEKYPNKLTIAEDLHGNDFVTAKVQDGGCGYGSQWDADFVHPIRDVIITMHDNDRNMDAVTHALTRRYNLDSFGRVVYTESHDEVANGKARVAEEISPGNVTNYYSKKRAALGVAMVLTAPGIPMLFQGQPLLEDKWFSDTDPVDWNRFSDVKGIIKLHRDLIYLRTNRHETTKGLMGQHIHILYVHHEDKIVAYHRWMEGGPKDSVVVVLNFRDQEHTHYTIPMPTKGKWKVRFNSDWGGYDDEFTDHPVYDTVAKADQNGAFATVSIAPYGAIILSQD